MPLVDEDGKETDLGLITIPFDQLEIIDDWYTLGLRGTGSNSIIAKDIFVPDHRVVSFTKTTQGHFESAHLRDIPLYNTALAPSLHLSLGLPGLGIAQAALETFLEKLPYRKVVNLGVKAQKDAAITHLQVGEASLKIDTARMHYYRVADALDEAAKSGEFMDVQTRMRCAADIGYANQHCKEAIDIVLEASGGSYVYDRDPFQRVYRDFSTMYVHRSISPTSFKENYGRLLSGIDLHTDALI
jgi:3-hydroxy-9,10-secoandrosta-1,3,5(10)-triene-9,17-dione monooxygenase